MRGVLADRAGGAPVATIAARVHNTLARAIAAVAERAGEPRVVLSGGCFQNRALSERAAAWLGAAGFSPYLHQRVPPNDGGLALGQVAMARWMAARDASLAAGAAASVNAV